MKALLKNLSLHTPVRAPPSAPPHIHDYMAQNKSFISICIIIYGPRAQSRGHYTL